jgi:inosine-uridine nucleoside N-ribohydrolase
MTLVIRLIVALSLLASACGDEVPAGNVAPTSMPADTRTAVILDYSPTVSDVGALLFLATDPRVLLIGVTLPGTGESHCDSGVAHTRGILDALGQGGVPVACGPEEAVGVLHAFPEGWRSRSDTMDLPEAPPNDARMAPDLIADLVAGSASDVRIVAVGPLTNVAIALTDHPEVARGISGITIMGGAVDVQGNVPSGAPGWGSANSRAEVNFWVDPTAADRVVRSGVPITLVPLDATNGVPADRSFYEALTSDPTTAASEILADVWDDAPEWLTDGYFLWDELAAVVAVDESVVVLEHRTLLVDDGDDQASGWSREDPEGVEVRVAVAANNPAFESLYLAAVLAR